MDAEACGGPEIWYPFSLPPAVGDELRISMRQQEWIYGGVLEGSATEDTGLETMEGSNIRGGNILQRCVTYNVV